VKTSKEFMDMATSNDTTPVQRNGAVPSQAGPPDYFIGRVRIDGHHQAPEPSRVSVAYVTFEPGARTNWHTHPLGQTLVVTAGVGWTQCEGGPVKEIRAGDVAWCRCQRRHWHGATPTTAMTHMAITEALDGKAVERMEPVTDEQYLAGPGRAAGLRRRFHPWRQHLRGVGLRSRGRSPDAHTGDADMIRPAFL
jgi:quercetin dioxygenase-like cupin family protein